MLRKINYRKIGKVSYLVFSSSGAHLQLQNFSRNLIQCCQLEGYYAFSGGNQRELMAEKKFRMNLVKIFHVLHLFVSWGFQSQ